MNQSSRPDAETSRAGMLQEEFVPVPVWVEERATKSPEAVAVETSEGSLLSYGELVGRARGLASILLKRELGSEARIGICLGRGGTLAIAELGTWFSGAAFVPLDPEAPMERLRAIVGDAGVEIVLADGATRGSVPPGCEVIRVDEVWRDEVLKPVKVEASQLAYVMYTSGSTGTPKGVMVEHGSVSNFVRWHREVFELSEESRTTLVYSPAFDSSMAELWPSLSAGARILVPDGETRLIPERLQSWLLEEEVTHTDLPSPLVDSLLERAWPAASSLRTMLSGGDRLHGRPAADCGWRLFNQYGPTEGTVTATSGEVSATGLGAPGIGRPIAGVTAYVLDEAMEPVPRGTVGELYLGGRGVARGYWNQPEATAERFVRDPFSSWPDARMYRTGDRVKLDATGEMVFCGRADDQIKLRGYRIEPAEIVAALRAHPLVSAAHVLLHNEALVAYIVSALEDGVSRDVTEIRAQLARTLPSYMVPSTFMWVDELPMTANGKVNVRALPAPSRAPVTADQRPSTRLEREIASVWQGVLARDDIGLDESFFEVGGNSLLLVRVHRALAVGERCDLPLMKLFEYPSIRSLAHYFEGNVQGVPTSAAVTAPNRGRLLRRRSRVNGEHSDETS